MFDEFEINDRILVLGDGDLSFSKAMLQKYSGWNLSFTCTVFESESSWNSIYPDGRENVDTLKRKVNLMFNVDATKLNEMDEISGKFFHRIIFNFPHPGGKTNLRKCKILLRGIFQSCSERLTENGRIYLTLASGQCGLSFDTPFANDGIPQHLKDSWQSFYLAAYFGLVLIKLELFPIVELNSVGYTCTGYKNKANAFNVQNARLMIFAKTKQVIVDDLLISNRQIENATDLHRFRPYYVHDVSFWVNYKFSQQTFKAICLGFAKGLIKKINMVDEFVDPHDTVERRSFCFRLFWQSVEFAMTKEAARDMQIELRNHLVIAIPADISFVLR